MEARNGFWDGSPKSLFYTGLFLGIAIVSTLGFGMSALGYISSGSSDNSGSGTQVVQAPPTGGAGAPTQQAAAPVKPFDAKNDHWRGGKDAKVTLIEYSDFECPFCKRFEPTLEQALKDFPKDLRVVYRHFPLSSIHPSAQKAAEASECAAKLGGNDAFWKMHKKLIDTATLSVDAMKNAAKDIGLDQGKFNSCLDSGEMANKVQQDFNEGGSAGVEGTPANFINGQLVSGAVPYEGAGGLKEALKAAGAAK